MHYGSFDDIFALPVQASFIMGFNKEELLNRMVSVPGSDIRKIVIPRNTTIAVNDTLFSLQYPIELRQMSHGGLQVVYDISKTTPLKTIETNNIEWKPIRDDSGNEMIFFPVYLDQFSIISSIDVITTMQKFSLSRTITDQFYYCRVFRESTQGWEEIPTTYSQDIYRNDKPTAIVKVINKEVTVEIPIVYVKTGQLSGKIRVDIYQTKGPMSVDMAGFDANQFIVNWLAIDQSERTSYVAPLKAMTSVTVYSNARTTGGRDTMTFEELKERELQNAFSASTIPITPAQAQKKLERDRKSVV